MPLAEIADVDLAAGDVVFAAVKGGGRAQPADCMFGGGVGCRILARHMAEMEPLMRLPIGTGPS